MLLKVRSFDFAKEFAISAEKILNKSDSYSVRRIVDSTGAWYLVKVTCFLLYDFVNQPLSVLRSYVEPNPRGFLRRISTAEGCSTVNMTQKGPALHVGVVVSNSDRTLLELSRKLLVDLGFHPGNIVLNFPRERRPTYRYQQCQGGCCICRG